MKLLAQTTGQFCEADVCTSDFAGTYDQTEAWFLAALDAFAAGQVVGFSAAIFDGSHFDILAPYEHYDGYSLNRSGETGFNNPALNIYLVQ